jgi:uncharacterized protein (DUF885 family)
MRRMVVLMSILLAGCGSKQPPASDFDTLTHDVIYGSLGLSPVAATGIGYHKHGDRLLDEMIDDYSAEGLTGQRRFYADVQRRAAAINQALLDREQRADLEIVKNNVELSLFELDTIQSYKHNPTLYVELAGNALFTPYVLNYAPRERRFQHIIKRLERLPALFEQARANLVDAPEVWNRVAREENQGNIDLIDKTLRMDAPEVEKAAFTRAADQALAALRAFNVFLADTLSKKTSDWRLGPDKYAAKFRYTLAIGRTPEQLLAEAEADLQATRAEMAKLAAPATVPQALDAIAAQHPTPDAYLAAARKALEQAKAFVHDKGLLTLPARGNLQVIETPEFMRGIYAVGGFNAAPALEPELGAFFWVTPIPSSWPRERIESKLREYNDYGIQELTIHEAMPGHYVQLEYANDVQPETRRLLRNVFGNGPYVEGWAFYAQQLMSDEGYLGGNSKALRLTFLKQTLRALANAILDIRLHTMGMTDQQALDLMIKDSYQEREEATAKLQRAQLSSCQLPTYYAGWKGWLSARERFKDRRTSAYTLRDFHERALSESAVPLPMLVDLIAN